MTEAPKKKPTPEEQKQEDEKLIDRIAEKVAAKLREQQKKEEEKPDEGTEKPKAWLCGECGLRLGEATWTSTQLTRAYPDGCPRCGANRAELGE